MGERNWKILNAHLYKLSIQINQIKCVVNFSDRYWKHPRSEICYLVRIEFIHSDVWTRIKELHLLRKCKLSTQSISPFSWPLFYVKLLLSSALSPGLLTQVKCTLEFCPLNRRKRYSHDIRGARDAAVHFHIHRLLVELVFGMQMQWLLRAEMERPNLWRSYVTCFPRFSQYLATAAVLLFLSHVAKPQRRQWLLDDADTSIAAIEWLAVLAEDNFITWKDDSIREIVYSELLHHTASWHERESLRI